MFPRSRILSVIACTSIVLLALLFRSQSSVPDSTSEYSHEYEHIIAIQLGDQPQVGVIVDGEFLHIDTLTSIPDSQSIQFDQPTTVDILETLKAKAEHYLGRKVHHAVVGVPASYNDTQRASIKKAGILAGLNILRLVREPTAACIAYNDKIPESQEVSILIYNLNSQTSDISIISAESGVYEILATARADFGSANFHQAELDSVNVIDDKILKSRVQLAEELIMSGASPSGIQQALTSLENEQVYSGIYKTALQPSIERVLTEGKLKAENINALIVTGNPKEVTKLKPFLERYLNQKAYDSINSNTAILLGLAKQATLFSGDEDSDNMITYIEVLPQSLGLNNNGTFHPIIPSASIIPTRRTITVTTIQNNQSAIIVDIQATNHALGSLKYPVSPADAGSPRIDIEFDVDPAGFLNVTISERGKNMAMRLAVGDVLCRNEEERIASEAYVKRADLGYDDDGENCHMSMRTREDMLIDKWESTMGWRVVEENMNAI